MNKSKTVFVFLIIFLVARLGATVYLFLGGAEELLGLSLLTVMVTPIGSIPQFSYGIVFLLAMIMLFVLKSRKIACIFGVLLMLTDLGFGAYYYFVELDPVYITAMVCSLLGVSLFLFTSEVTKA